MGNTDSNSAEDLEGSGLVFDAHLEKKLINDAKKRDKEVKNLLKAKLKSEASTVKLLLLGAGESGKTTVLKQMTLLHGGGFNDTYKKEMKPNICFNVLEGAHTILNLCERENHQLEGDDITKASTLIRSRFESTVGGAADIDPELADAILLLAKTEDFHEMFGKKSELQDSWWDFAERLKKYPAWGGEKWVPDDADILLSRVRTTGIVNQLYKIDGVNFQMTDVGGQRCERKKWMTLFKGITGLIFVTSISGYNQRLFEDTTTNCLVESVNLWETYANKKEFEDSAILLFLNKFDLFQQKFFREKIPIEYKGEFVTREGQNPPKPEDEQDENCDLAVDWYKRLFYYHVRPERQPMVYVHVTTALDRQNMRTVINACASHVLQMNMKANGIMV